MAKGKTASKHQQALYQQYKIDNRSQKNRTERLKRHVNNNPNDEQAEAVLKKGVVEYRRKKPMAKKWTPSMRRMASLAKQAGMKGDVVLKWEEDKKRRLKNAS